MHTNNHTYKFFITTKKMVINGFDYYGIYN